MYSEFLIKMGRQEEIDGQIQKIERSISPAKASRNVEPAKIEQELIFNQTIESVR